MSETKFTPGPWLTSQRKGFMLLYKENKDQDGVTTIAEIEAVEPANAKLIAAAPDMYAELQDTHEHLLMLYSAISGRSMDFETILQELRDRMTKQRKLIDKATN